MISPRKNIRLYLLLGLAVVLMAAVAADHWLGQRGPDTTVASEAVPNVVPAAPADVPVSGAGANPAAAISADDFHDIDDRPLFNPARQRVPLADETASAVPGSADSFALGDAQLVGLVSSPGRRFAVLRRKTANQVVRVEEGQAFDGWLLSEVSAQEAIFQKDGTRRPLKLFRSPESPSAGVQGAFPGAVPPERAIIPTDAMLGIGKGAAH